MNLHKTMSASEAIRFARNLDCRVEMNEATQKLTIYAPKAAYMEPDRVVIGTRPTAPIGHLVRWLKRLSRMLFEVAMAEGATTPLVVGGPKEAAAPTPPPPARQTVLNADAMNSRAPLLVPLDHAARTSDAIARHVAKIGHTSRPPPRWVNQKFVVLRERIEKLRREHGHD